VKECDVPRLIVIRGVDEGKQFELNAPSITVGRHSANAVSLHDTQVSRRLLARPEQDIASAIVRTVTADAGSQILSRPAAATDWLRVRLASLAALYETAEVISHILDVDQLLNTVMDLVFKSVDADHGCFMVRDEDGKLVPKAVRYREGVNRQEELAVSRTVVEYVLKEKQGVLVSDVYTDDRFRGVESLHRHNIREAICVPMKGRRE